MIREENEKDWAAVHELYVAAFETSAEAKLVDVLRQKGHPLISLVFEKSNQILGHIMFSAITIEELKDKTVLGLAPMAVLPQHQRAGIGSALVEAGLSQCREIGAGAVVVLGHPEYYPRFGFRPAVEFGFKSEYEVPDDVFMAIEIEPDYLQGVSGLAKYDEVFKNV